jgi:hypothetical protein
MRNAGWRYGSTASVSDSMKQSISGEVNSCSAGQELGIFACYGTHNSS